MVKLDLGVNIHLPSPNELDSLRITSAPQSAQRLRRSPVGLLVAADPPIVQWLWVLPAWPPDSCKRPVRDRKPIASLRHVPSRTATFAEEHREAGLPL